MTVISLSAYLLCLPDSLNPEGNNFYLRNRRGFIWLKGQTVLCLRFAYSVKGKAQQICLNHFSTKRSNCFMLTVCLLGQKKSTKEMSRPFLIHSYALLLSAIDDLQSGTQLWHTLKRISKLAPLTEIQIDNERNPPIFPKTNFIMQYFIIWIKSIDYFVQNN